MIAGRD
jgi:ribonuclease E